MESASFQLAIGRRHLDLLANFGGVDNVQIAAEQPARRVISETKKAEAIPLF